MFFSVHYHVAVLYVCLREHLYAHKQPALQFVGCALYAVSLYISLIAAGEAGLSEPCDVLQPNVGLHVRLCFPCACSSMSAPEL